MFQAAVWQEYLIHGMYQYRYNIRESGMGHAEKLMLTIRNFAHGEEKGVKSLKVGDSKYANPRKSFPMEFPIGNIILFACPIRLSIITHTQHVYLFNNTPKLANISAKLLSTESQKRISLITLQTCKESQCTVTVSCEVLLRNVSKCRNNIQRYIEIISIR